MIQVFLNMMRRMGLEYYGRYYSVYRGLVTDNDDPKGLNRLRLKVEQITGSTPYKYWALPFGMPAESNGTGFKHTPGIGQMVWVQFEGGNPRYPVWSHGYWGNGESPGISPGVHQWKTSSGQIIRIDDEKEEIRIIHTSGSEVLLKNDGIFIGNENENLHKILSDLRGIINQTRISTQLGPQPFINLQDWLKVMDRFNEVLNGTK